MKIHSINNNISMCEADKLAEEDFIDNYVINQLMKSGKDSILLST